jgi:hypothetical protein
VCALLVTESAFAAYTSPVAPNDTVRLFWTHETAHDTRYPLLTTVAVWGGDAQATTASYVPYWICAAYHTAATCLLLVIFLKGMLIYKPPTNGTVYTLRLLYILLVCILGAILIILTAIMYWVRLLLFTSLHEFNYHGNTVRTKLLPSPTLMLPLLADVFTMVDISINIHALNILPQQSRTIHPHV